MMASSNPEDWVNYEMLLQGPHANRLLEIVNRRNKTDCPYCIDMLTMDEQVTGMCSTCKSKCALPVIDLTHLTDNDDDDDSVAPVDILNDHLYNSPMHHEELDKEAFHALTFEMAEMVDFEYYPKDMVPEMGGAFVCKRKREKSLGEQRKAQSIANEKRRRKDAETNLKTLHEMIDGFQDISDQVKELVQYKVPSSVINSLVCKIDDVENCINNLKLRSKV